MSRIAPITAIAALAAPAAWAHGAGAPVTPVDVWHHWNFDPAIWAPLLLAHWLYGRGLVQAWRRGGVGRIIPAWRAMCFLGGEIFLVIALISPLDPLGETLLTAHMIQHVLLTAVAPLFLVLGLPLRAWTWAIPKTWRRLGALPAIRSAARKIDGLSRPLAATLIAGVVLWAWHAPALFEAALQNPLLHMLEHVTFLATSLLLWRAALNLETSPIAAVGAVLLSFMVSGMLGGLLCLAPVQLYDWYGGYAALWGLSALEDQQLAGAVMWAPAGGAYLIAFAILALRVGGSSSPRSRINIGIIRANTSSRSMK